MDYITRFYLINFKKDNWFILGEIKEYVEHLNINDILTVKIEVRKQGQHTPVDYPIISGRIDHISKCIENGFGTGTKQLVTGIGLHIDIETIEYIKSIIENLQKIEKELNINSND